jgi:hypothetical protein
VAADEVAAPPVEDFPAAARIIQAVVDAGIQVHPTPAEAIPEVAGTTLMAAAAAIPEGTTFTVADAAIPGEIGITTAADADTTAAEEATTPAASTRVEATFTADASGLDRTTVSGSVFPSAGATIRITDAVTTMDGAIGNPRHAIRIWGTVTVTEATLHFCETEPI